MLTHNTLGQRWIHNLQYQNKYDNILSSSPTKLPLARVIMYTQLLIMFLCVVTRKHFNVQISQDTQKLVTRKDIPINLVTALCSE